MRGVFDMAKQVEWVPWYRRKDCKITLTEDEKRHLDSFRLGERHPAVDWDELPEEAQSYVGQLELDIYDAKQDAVVGRAFVLTFFGAFILFLAYHDLSWFDPVVTYFIGGVVIVYAWVNCRREHKKNADGLFPEYLGNGAPFSPTHEGLQAHWESLELTRYRRQKRATEEGA